jgi:hypothetical protein
VSRAERVGDIARVTESEWKGRGRESGHVVRQRERNGKDGRETEESINVPFNERERDLGFSVTHNHGTWCGEAIGMMSHFLWVNLSFTIYFILT